jgi:integrase
MSARRKPTPSYLEHKQSGRARAVWTDSSGTRHQQLLPGPFDSSESRTAFARLQLEIEASPHHVRAAAANGTTINELFDGFLDHAEQHYVRADGSQTPEVDEYKSLSRLVRETYGDTRAQEFGPVCLKAMREVMVGRGWCAAEELIAFEVFNRLTTVSGLQRGRSKVRDTEPVGPVADSVVDATLPKLNRYVRAMVEFQRLTGCRPGEVCRIRRSEIDMEGEVWLFKLAQHKTAWRGKPRVIAIGPKAQALLKAFFTRSMDDYLFSARRSMEEFRASQRAKRKTRVQPSKSHRTKLNPKRRPGERYTTRAYSQAITTGCKRAQVEHWHPNQLRHSHATKVRKAFTLEHAGASLGHSKMSATEIYAERDAGLALEVAAKIG